MGLFLSMRPPSRCITTKSPGTRRKGALSKFRSVQEASPFPSSSSPSSSSPSPGRTYREELYAGRTISATRMPSSVALSRLFDVVRNEGIMDVVRRKREWIRPGLAASLERMRRRHARFNRKVRESIQEVNEIYRRLE